MHDEINKLIEYRINKSNETVKEVDILIHNQLFALAINRIYYEMFYMLLALSLKNGFKSSKHGQLIGWFNKEFIKTGKVDRKFGKIIHDAFENRTDSDYGVFVEFEKEEILQRHEEMKEFISTIENII